MNEEVKQKTKIEKKKNQMQRERETEIKGKIVVKNFQTLKRKLKIRFQRQTQTDQTSDYNGGVPRDRSWNSGTLCCLTKKRKPEGNISLFQNDRKINKKRHKD